MRQLRNLIISAFALLALNSCQGDSAEGREGLSILYPADHTLFPPDMAAPTFRWDDASGESVTWEVLVKNSKGELIIHEQSDTRQWRPGEQNWEEMKKMAGQGDLEVSIQRRVRAGEAPKTAAIRINCSEDEVGAPIFFRSVPLPFKFARENLKKINWHLGNVSTREKAPVVLSNIPVCGNCHSFSTDGQYMAMDVDARDEKGAYVISRLEEKTALTEDKLINWSDAQNGDFTYGLLSQISPGGRYVVSTLKDCEIFVDRPDMEYSQLFFPFKGILQVYDRQTDSYYELPGARDTTFVHSNPSWSPDGKYIYFSRSLAAHFEESGIHHGSKATNHQVYSRFLNRFLEREKLFKFEIYRIPFNEGKGGKAEPVLGASDNGLSNYFPKISPDGKWLVFCQAESFMLLQKDSKLVIIPAEGGQARILGCNSENMNSWHTWSPNSRWLAFSSKANGPYTQMFLTHIDEEGRDSPAILVENMTFLGRAVNIPEFVNIAPGMSVEIDPAFLNQGDFALRSAQIKHREGALEGALEGFKAVIQSDSRNAEAFHGRGEVYLKLGRPAEGLADLNRAIALNQGVPDYYLSRGIALGNTGDYKGAFSDFGKALELDPQSFMAYNDRAVLEVRIGQLDAALSDYDSSIRLNPDAAMTYVNRGAARAMVRDVEGALADFDQAINLDGDLLMPYITRSMMKEEQNNIPGALADLGIAFQMDPANLNLLERRARLYLKIPDYQAAMADLDRIILLVPDRGDTYFNKAMVQLQLSNSDSACVNLQRALDKGYNDAEIYLTRYCK